MTHSTGQEKSASTKAIRYGEAVIGLCVLGLCTWAAMSGAQQAQSDITSGTTVTAMNQVLGRPTNSSISVSVLAPNDMEVYAEYGVAPGNYTGKTSITNVKARIPVELGIDKLKANSRYYYRLRYKPSGSNAFVTGTEYSFQTQRPPGSSYVFDVQADSHPERNNEGPRRMFHPELYARTMANVRKDHPDFFITLGDDFSIDILPGGTAALSPQVVSQVYINQRPYLGQDGAAAPIFLVNGNHEQAAKYLLNGTPNTPAVWAGKARNSYFPQPAIGDGKFYTGDKEQVEHIGYLNDYYAWTWGDALFITLDPYWHSDVAVGADISPNAAANGMAGMGGGMEAAASSSATTATTAEPVASGMGGKDIWNITHGEAQYHWLEQTLKQSKAKYKFIFAHHVLGTGRGAVEMVEQGEWGGKGLNGVWEFDKKRPGWSLPIHQLMVKYKVSAFFQGHDHIYVRQEKDGVVYQETPNPANPNYEDENGGFRNSYKTGDYLPASGHLRVSISPEIARVDYIRSWMPKDETPEHKQGEVAFSYTIKPALNTP